MILFHCKEGHFNRRRDAYTNIVGTYAYIYGVACANSANIEG